MLKRELRLSSILRVWLAALLVGGVSVGLAGGNGSAVAAQPGCVGPHYVASWAASPTDSITPVDASGGPVPLVVHNQTFRMVVTPHLDGPLLRVHLSNRFGTTAVTFGHVTVADQVQRAKVTAPTPVLFHGKATVTVPVGHDVVSDPVAFPVTAFKPVAISIHVPGPVGPPTKHWNANATSYQSAPGSGDLTDQSDARRFDAVTRAWFYVNALDVLAPPDVRSVVAFGDSITDGFVGSTPMSVPADISVADTNMRYPDVLQRRLLAKRSPISVVNAGVGSNRLLTSGEPLLLGPSGLARFQRDALQQSGVTGVILLEGINDLGFPPGADADAMISGYKDVIAQARRAGVKIWLGTIVPASDALVDGVLLAPASERNRQVINRWIRGQHMADGIVDFDAVMRNPVNPAVMRSEYASPDRLHPSTAGYRAMGDAVDLAMLAQTRTAHC